MPLFPYLDPTRSPRSRASDLLARMTYREKLGQLCQYVAQPLNTAASDAPTNQDEVRDYSYDLRDWAELIREGKIGSFLLKNGSPRFINQLQQLTESSRLKIPLLFGEDAIHGIGMMQVQATIFPTPITLASTFDSNLLEKCAAITAREMRAVGQHWSFSPSIDLVRDARWGRTGETFGEDPHLITQLGLAMIRGYQGKSNELGFDHVLACAKHLVGGGQSINGINAAPSDISEHSLHNYHYPAFKAAVEAGVRTFMAAHNEINGIPCHANAHLFRTLLRDQWKFTGWVVSDWMDMERLAGHHHIAATPEAGMVMSFHAGVDMHMHGPGYDTALENAGVPEDKINRAILPILEDKFALGLFENRYIDEAKIPVILRTEEAQQTSLDAARKGIVLLKNDGLLPLSIDKIKRIFITGPHAANRAFFGDWVVDADKRPYVTLIEGLKAVSSGTIEVDHYDCGTVHTLSPEHITEAAARAQNADVAILVLGEWSLRDSPERTCGENVGRTSISLFGKQEALLRTVAAMGTPTILILTNGRPNAVEWAEQNLPAIIEAWEPGPCGGRALAEILFGLVNPSGKLPITIPRNSGQVQCFYNYPPSTFSRDKGCDADHTPLYPFGHGLSYTMFEYSNLQVPENLSIESNVSIQLNVTNTGDREGEEVVLIYVRDLVSSVSTPIKALKAFKRIRLRKGETAALNFEIQNADLALRNAEGRWAVEPGEFLITIGRLQAKIRLV